MSTLLKGICYAAFPAPYNPSTANNSCIFFGSDASYNAMESLWGPSYTSTTGKSYPNGRNDLSTLKSMGVNLIRLYDWEPRNLHLKFLDLCTTLGIKVLVPVSNYFLTDGFSSRDILIPNLIKSFSNSDGSDYHSAIAGIIIGNEPELNGYTSQTCVDFTLSWVNAEQASFSNHSMPMIGHPVDFGLYGGEYPAWGFWEPLLTQLDNIPTRNLEARLFLAPQTYNDGNYLYKNAGNGTGYVDLTWNKFKKPMIFTEIGQDRTKPNYIDTIKGQLSGAIKYASANPNVLLGICNFQFTDKVWMQGTSEGSFGAFSHTSNISTTVTFGNGDFTHWDHGSCAGSTLNVDVLSKNPVYNTITSIYNGTSLPQATHSPVIHKVSGETIEILNENLSALKIKSSDVFSITHHSVENVFIAFYR